MHLEQFLDLLANEITVRREKLGLNLAQAAKELGMPTSDLQIFEDAKGIPDLYDWLKMCDLYNFSFAVPKWTKSAAPKASAKDSAKKAAPKKSAAKKAAPKKKK